MTNTHQMFGRHATLAVVCVVLLACTLVVPAVGQTPPSLSKKELKTLSATPAGQERLAAYYRDKTESEGEGAEIRGTAAFFSDTTSHPLTQTTPSHHPYH